MMFDHGPRMKHQQSAIGTFLSRWSRRKGISRQPLAETEDAHDRASPTDAPALFDVAGLTPIETIEASSDIRRFLLPDVPEELRRAALQRAWLTCPAIREFIGIADNQWDFNQVDGVPGFGSLAASADLDHLVSELLGSHPEPVRIETEADRATLMQSGQSPEPAKPAGPTGLPDPDSPRSR